MLPISLNIGGKMKKISVHCRKGTTSINLKLYDYGKDQNINGRIADSVGIFGIPV